MSTNTTEGIQSYPHEADCIEDKLSALIEIVERQQEQINELQEELESTRKDAAEDRQRITKTETRIDDLEGDKATETPTPETDNNGITEPETPIEDIIRIPEHLVEDSLTANQQRSRAVAKDFHQYSKSVPAGRAIKSSELRRVLSAHEDGSTTHTETVSRVMTMLDDLGKEAINVRTSQSGEKVVVFEDDLVRRIVAYQNNHDVVIDTTVQEGAET
jgi:chromosome segregation ATPase